MDNLYDILGVTEDAPQDEIKGIPYYVNLHIIVVIE